ncbi:MAG: hypothetical protein MJ188_01705 [Treponema sp.]|nr:hypothetical protein [Treponema sp.]
MKKIILTCFLLGITLALFVACKKNQNTEYVPEIVVENTKSNHQWFYFTESGVEPIDLPQKVPNRAFQPWTETIRISSANSASSEEYTQNSGKAFAVVNRLGMLCFEKDNFYLAQDVMLFSNRTAENLVFFNDTPLFSVYKSSFFNPSIQDPNYKDDEMQHNFLVQFDSAARISYPLVNSTNLTKEPFTEVVDYTWDGENWLCSLKSIYNGKVNFFYLNWHPNTPILSISPWIAEENITISESDVDTFRASKALIDYSLAPERIKKMLTGFSSKVPFILEIKSVGGASSRQYENHIENTQEMELKAKAIIAESWSSVLFEDGTLFIEGALPGKHILRGGKTIAIRLPKLPDNFVYSDFVISGTTLYAAWEETRFYETARSGFLSVDLDATLYQKLR